MIDWLLGRNRAVETRRLPVLLLFSAVMLGARLFLAYPFWLSGQTRWVAFPTQLASTTTYLFENEFMLHLGFATVPIPYAGLVAYMTGVAEIILPILLALGILSRLSSLALLAMTIVIELVFPDAWPIHMQWAIVAVAIAVAGSGTFSLDWVIRKFALRRSQPLPTM